MKTKTIIIIFILAYFVSMTGVAIFITKGISKDIGRFVMVVGLILNATWFIGLTTNLYKRYIK